MLMMVHAYLDFYVEHLTNTSIAAVALADQEAAAALADQEAAALVAGNATAVAGI
jgi:hypothetical protein